MGKSILITGGAGYIGQLLVMHLSELDSITTIIVIDKEPVPDRLKNIQKLRYVQKNLVDNSWEEEVSIYKPEIVIHCAWQIRESYTNQQKHTNWNINGSKRVFDFAFTNNFVRRLIHYSTVASYGAFDSNSLDEFFKEETRLRPSPYSYAEEKRLVENTLRESFEKLKENKKFSDLQVAVIRPASITGPFGRLQYPRFGLQSVLLGFSRKRFLNLNKILFSFIPVTPKWCRQFVYEEDIVDITILLALKDQLINDYDVFNAAPGDVLLGKDMSALSGKQLIVLPPFLIRLVFFLAWHLSRGRIPTAQGSWRGYSFPIVVDGSKITKMYGYKYKLNSREALTVKD